MAAISEGHSGARRKPEGDGGETITGQTIHGFFLSADRCAGLALRL